MSEQWKELTNLFISNALLWSLAFVGPRSRWSRLVSGGGSREGAKRQTFLRRFVDFLHPTFVMSLPSPAPRRLIIPSSTPTDSLSPPLYIRFLTRSSVENLEKGQDCGVEEQRKFIIWRKTNNVGRRNGWG